MKKFEVIFKILKILEKNMGREDFDYKTISAEAMKLSYEEWEQLMILMQEGGYIDGIVCTRSINEKFYHIVEPICPTITLKGLEYLEENGMMAKVKNALKMAGDLKPW